MGARCQSREVLARASAVLFPDSPPRGGNLRLFRERSQGGGEGESAPNSLAPTHLMTPAAPFSRLPPGVYFPAAWVWWRPQAASSVADAAWPEWRLDPTGQVIDLPL